MVKNYPLKLSIELFDYCLKFSFDYSRLRIPVTVLFFVTILFDEVRPTVLCIHTKLIIVCHRLQAVKKERLLVVYVFVVFASGARTAKMFYLFDYDIT